MGIRFTAPKPDLYLYDVVIRLHSVGRPFLALQSTASSSVRGSFCSLCMATCTELRRWLYSQLFVALYRPRSQPCSSPDRTGAALSLAKHQRCCFRVSRMPHALFLLRVSLSGTNRS